MQLIFIYWFYVLKLYWIHLVTILFLSDLDELYFFSCLIAVARTFNIVLKKSGSCGYHCLVTDHGRKTLSFSSLNMMSAVGLSCMPSHILRYIPSLPTVLRIFVMNGCRILSSPLLPSWDGYMIFIPHVVNVVYPVDWFADVEIL